MTQREIGDRIGDMEKKLEKLDDLYWMMKCAVTELRLMRQEKKKK